MVAGQGAPGAVLDAGSELVVACGNDALAIGAATARQPPAQSARVPARAPARPGAALRLSALAADLAQAARIVARVAGGASLADEFDPRPAIIDLTHGTLRRYGRVQAIVRELSHRARSDTLVEALLWCALYALESQRYADYAVVDQAVRACALRSSAGARRAT